MRTFGLIAPVIALALGLILTFLALDCANMCHMRDTMHVDMPCMASVLTGEPCSWGTFRQLVTASVVTFLAAGAGAMAARRLR